MSSGTVLERSRGGQTLPLNVLLSDIDKHREHANLSSVIRLYVLDYYRRLAEEAALEGKR